MHVELDRISIPKSPWQAREIQTAVVANREVLAEVNPGALRRYRDYPHALKNTLRVALAAGDGLHGFLIREERDERKAKAARGIATIIRGFAMTLENGNSYRGNVVDYWLDPAANEELHTAVGLALIRKSRAVKLNYEGELGPAGKNGEFRGGTTSGAHRLFAVASVGHEHVIRGLTGNMWPIGEPGKLSVLPDDRFDIGMNGDIIQLFGAELPASGDLDPQPYPIAS